MCCNRLFAKSYDCELRLHLLLLMHVAQRLFLRVQSCMRSVTPVPKMGMIRYFFKV